MKKYSNVISFLQFSYFSLINQWRGSRFVNVMGNSVYLAETANQYSKSGFPDFMRHLIGNY